MTSSRPEVFPVSLVAQWRSEAAQNRRRGQGTAATLIESLADELEESLTSFDSELLTLHEAGAESGYTPDALGRLLRQGTIPNSGRPNAPRIRRCDLPRKPGRNGDGQSPVSCVGSKEQIARSIVNSDDGGNDG